MPTPSNDELEEVLLSCRYGELEEVEQFVNQYGWEALSSARDDRGNTCLHMCCGNGHLDVLKYILPHIPSSLLQQTNEAGTPPLHWAILNNHVSVVKLLTELPEEQGGGIVLLHQKNSSGREAFMEAIFAGEGKEEVAGWIEGYLFKVEGGEDIELPEGKETDEKVEEPDKSGVPKEEGSVKELEEGVANAQIGVPQGR